MNTRIVIFFFLILSTITISPNAWARHPKQKEKNKGKSKEKVESTKEPKDKVKLITVKKTDSLKNKLTTENIEVVDSIAAPTLKFKFYKKDAHASYYAQKFNGKRTASGILFDNNKYTAAHKKLPFGTKIKVTNEANGKSVIVEVTDRGPFSKVREIDLSKKAFMELVDNKNTGAVMVKLEVEDK